MGEQRRARSAWWSDLLRFRIIHIAEVRPGSHSIGVYERGMRTGGDVAADLTFGDALMKALAISSQGTRILIDLECWKARP